MPATGSSTTDTDFNSAALLEVDHLSIAYRGRQGSIPIIRDVSLSLRRGGSLGIVGESGSGKSVLSRSIMGLDRRRTAERSGAVRLAGTDLDRLSTSALRRHWGTDMSIVLQDPLAALNPVRRVGDQVAESLRLRLGVPRAAAHARAIELLRTVSIADPERRARQYPHELSGGMRQRVVIAIAIACDPALLIADEPTTALDVTVQDQILDLLQAQQQQRRMGLILISHDLGVVASRTEQIAVMYSGEVVETAPTPALFARPRMPYTGALLAAIPRRDVRPHSMLQVIPGEPPNPAMPQQGCRFASRCASAQPRCLTDAPPLAALDVPDHLVRCWYPLGTPHGEQARTENAAAGRTASGRTLTTNTIGGEH